jgi:signal transduction histidine kinase
LADRTAVRRTLRGRVSLLGLAVIAAWMVILTIAFNVLFANRLDRDIDSLLRARAAATSATLSVDAAGGVQVREQRADQVLDAGIWVYSGNTAVERPTGAADLQSLADMLASRGGGFVDGPNDARLYGLPVKSGDRPVGMVVTSASTAPYEHARTTAIQGSVVVALLVLIGAYPVLRIAGSRALRPVDEMTSRAADWSAHALSERFGTHQRYREMQTLAGTLDGVLDRLTAIVRHEQRLSAELSHELRTPLSTIVAEADLLLAGPHSPEQLNEAHRAIHDSAVEMDRILETLLAAAKVDIQDAPGRCELRPVVERLVRTRRETPSVTIDVHDELGVGVDAPIVERILAPILDNAYRYAASAVTVRARRIAASVVIEISDDGPGVAGDLRDEVFEPGRRGNAADGHDGAGLGLALSRRLARAAAGDVTLTADSTFAIRLPPA